MGKPSIFLINLHKNILGAKGKLGIIYLELEITISIYLFSKQTFIEDIIPPVSSRYYSKHNANPFITSHQVTYLLLLDCHRYLAHCIHLHKYKNSPQTWCSLTYLFYFKTSVINFANKFVGKLVFRNSAFDKLAGTSLYHYIISVIEHNRE